MLKVWFLFFFHLFSPTNKTSGIKGTKENMQNLKLSSVKLQAEAFLKAPYRNPYIYKKQFLCSKGILGVPPLFKSRL